MLSKLLLWTRAELRSRLQCGKRPVATGPYESLVKFDNSASAKCHFIQNLRQVWFPGVHSNIGGGYEDQSQANITLAWMIAQLEPFLEFDPDYVLDQYEENRDHYKKKGQKPRPWSFGR